MMFLYVLFFISGASGLISEVTWNRMLVLVVGNTVTATSIIVMAFMGGLCLGSYWGGHYFGKRRYSILPYAILEFSIGLYVLFSPFVFHLLSKAFIAIAPFVAGTPFIHTARVSLTLCVLTIPTFLMGATYPSIISSLSRDRFVKRASQAGYFYSINTLGAALGCIVAGYFLLPRLGIQRTLFCASALNFLAAAGAFILNAVFNTNKEPDRVETKIGEDTQASLGRGVFFVLSLATFFIGFVALSYQVLLVRIIILFFGSLKFVFAMVLTAFLTATGVSAFFGTVFHGFIKRTERLFTAVIMIAAILIPAAPLLLLRFLHSEAIKDFPAMYDKVIIFALILLPVLFIGSLLPIIIKIFQTHFHIETTFSAARLYALNTLGGVIGAGTTNTFLVPILGAQGTLSLFSILFLCLGFITILLVKRNLITPLISGLCVVVLIVVIVRCPNITEDLYISALMRNKQDESIYDTKLFHEGTVANIAVVDSPDGGRFLFLDGVGEVSTKFMHVQLFKALSLLPILLHESDEPKEALMIAFGAGLSAGAALDTGQLSSLEVVDLVSEAGMINPYFKAINNDVYHHRQFHFVNDDGRNYLLGNPKKYSVIISDATHPFTYDSWILYTTEFYREVKNHLTSDGIFAQWIPLTIQKDFFRILVKTFSEVFKHCTFWCIYGSDQAFIMATPKPFALDFQRFQNRLDSIPESAKLKEYELDRAVNIASFFVMDEKSVREFIKDEKRINTDDYPYNITFGLEKYLSSQIVRLDLDRDQASILPYLVNATENEKQEIEELQVFAKTMLRFYAYQDINALMEARAIRPDNGITLYHTADREFLYPDIGPDTNTDQPAAEDTIDGLLAAIEEKPDTLSNYSKLAVLYANNGNPAKAKTVINKALRISPGSMEIHGLAGAIEEQMNNWAEAERRYRFLLKKRPTNVFYLRHLLRVLATTGRHQAAVSLLLQFDVDRSNWAGNLKYLYYQTIALSYFRLGNFVNAEKYALLSLEQYPNNNALRKVLADYYRQVSDTQKLLEQTEIILSINPYNLPALESLVTYYQEHGMDDQAKPFLTRLERAKELQRTED